MYSALKVDVGKTLWTCKTRNWSWKKSHRLIIKVYRYRWIWWVKGKLMWCFKKEHTLFIDIDNGKALGTLATIDVLSERKVEVQISRFLPLEDIEAISLEEKQIFMQCGRFLS